jgi:endonuclease III related protein
MKMKTRANLSCNDVYDALSAAWGTQHWWPAETPFEVAVGAVLTQNTAWTNVEKAIAKLKTAGALTALSLLELSESDLAQLVRSAGTCNVKARYLRTLASWIQRRAAGDLSSLASEDPETLRNDLLALRGVGKETADSILLYAVGQPAFVIDSYTVRTGTRLHLVPEHVDYDAAQHIFMTQLPADLHTYQECHALLVRLAKEYCRVRPVCSGCPLESRCPSAHRVVQKPRAARRTPAWEMAS